MKKIGLPLTLLIILTWAALQPSEILSFSAAYMPMRKAFTVLTGALALGWMGFCMLLALRPIWLERYLGGLDKLYHVHKWAGIVAVLLVVVHWLIILSPKTLVSWGLLDLPARRPHGPGHGGGGSLTGFAKEMGEWDAWLMIALGIVALLRFVPYGWFRKLHKGFPVAFLIGAFHGAVLLPDGSAMTPFGWLVIAISIGGSFVALKSLFGRIGNERQHRGRVLSAQTTEAGVLDLRVDPGANWPGHAAGQFALVTLELAEGPHPFTIVSDWGGNDRWNGELRFAIKPLGDYTRSLAGRFKKGDPVVVEGPYGKFDFGDVSEEQVWIAGGVGVAPFIARLEKLAASGGAQGKVHFFYSTHDAKEASFPVGLEELCRKAGVELHKRVTASGKRVTSGEIGRCVGKASSVWFCGPAAWGRDLQTVLSKEFGLAPHRFHRELFEFR